MNPDSVIFHLKNYFNLEPRMNRWPYFAIIFAHAALITPYMISATPDQTLEATSNLFRDDPFQRALHLLYNLVLIPAHIKRMKDIGWSPKVIEAILYMFYIPSLLVLLLSDSGFATISPILILTAFPEIMLSIFLMVREGETGGNIYGNDPLKGKRK